MTNRDTENACPWCGEPSRPPDPTEKLPGKITRICDPCNLVFTPSARREFDAVAVDDGEELITLGEYAATEAGRNDPHLAPILKALGWDNPDGPPAAKPPSDDLKRAIAEHYAAWGFAPIREENWPNVLAQAQRSGAGSPEKWRARPWGASGERNVGDLHHVGEVMADGAGVPGPAGDLIRNSAQLRKGRIE